MNIHQITEDMQLLTDWEDKYSYIIDLGKNLQPMPEKHKTDANKVNGCTSQVWLTHTTEKNGAGAQHCFTVDSDAIIVKGLLALLLALYNGKTSEEIQALDAAATLTDLGLAAHISPNRRNGFAAITHKIKSFAA